LQKFGQNHAPVSRLAFICPLSPSSAVRPPKGHDWLHEPKWDGFRFQVIKDARSDRGRMAKRNTKPKAKTKRRAPRPRTWLKDERGVPLTDNRMAQPPGTPTKAAHEIRGDRPTTAIPELKAIEFTEFAFQAVIEASLVR